MPSRLPNKWTYERRGQGHTLYPQPSRQQHRPRLWPQHPSNRTGFLPYRPQNRARDNGSFGVPKALPHSSLNPGRAAGGKGRGWLCSNPETRITRGAVCDIVELANAHAQCSWSRQLSLSRSGLN